MYISLWENSRGHPDNVSFMQFSTKIDGFEQKDSQGIENSYNSYEQYPLEKFFIFTIYQNYTLALMVVAFFGKIHNNNNNNNNDLLSENGKSEMENLFWKFFLPNWSWARQPLSSARSTLLYPFQMLSAKQGSSNSHLLTSFGMTRPGIEPTTSRLWGGRSTDWANTHLMLLVSSYRVDIKPDPFFMYG